MAAIKYRGSKAVTNFDVGPYTQNPSFPQSQPCPAPPLEMFPELTQLQPQPQPQPRPYFFDPADLVPRQVTDTVAEVPHLDGTSGPHPASPSTSPMAMTSPNCTLASTSPRLTWKLRVSCLTVISGRVSTASWKRWKAMMLF
ncbi:unnamed protein product [Musa textilis]